MIELLILGWLAGAITVGLPLMGYYERLLNKDLEGEAQKLEQQEDIQLLDGILASTDDYTQDTGWVYANDVTDEALNTWRDNGYID